MNREKASNIQIACLAFGNRHPVLALQKDTAAKDRFTARVRATHFTQEEINGLTGIAHRQGVDFDIYGVGQTGGVEFRFFTNFGV